ncbi:DUF2956 domain-containing protein [Aestuariirhabdus litorea]|uniref:DUF2956 domain-containing protein n=1 Tax=Aestuariirhabdus litorea TaxID=2528527 RepID=A0A3P3VRJ1_9GAMM|nr:DUF2956 domain-containing protein [Aestuariirhabdus litorea]RRJ85391.1 DUF2956 domain-containing protein [Aestuariirhabdus litorea]RWW96867.1 DUF2956 family protein [Endozoicomonadaceae bacterium GTF-13]
MAKHNAGEKKRSERSGEEALAIARATQKPGQSKEQTRLIAQGIQKGIEQYKRQQKAKARELDKRLKQVRRRADVEPVVPEARVLAETPVPRSARLPWVLLLLSWCAMGAALGLGLV